MSRSVMLNVCFVRMLLLLLGIIASSLHREQASI